MKNENDVFFSRVLANSFLHPHPSSPTTSISSIKVWCVWEGCRQRRLAETLNTPLKSLFTLDDWGREKMWLSPPLDSWTCCQTECHAQKEARAPCIVTKASALVRFTTFREGLPSELATEKMQPPPPAGEPPDQLKIKTVSLKISLTQLEKNN